MLLYKKCAASSIEAWIFWLQIILHLTKYFTQGSIHVNFQNYERATTSKSVIAMFNNDYDNTLFTIRN